MGVGREQNDLGLSIYNLRLVFKTQLKLFKRIYLHLRSLKVACRLCVTRKEFTKFILIQISFFSLNQLSHASICKFPGPFPIIFLTRFDLDEEEEVRRFPGAVSRLYIFNLRLVYLIYCKQWPLSVN